MAGTSEGGKQAAATNKKKYGSDFYRSIGAMGGKKGKTGGFYANILCFDRTCSYKTAHQHFVRECAGAKGGTVSRRGKTTV